MSLLRDEDSSWGQANSRLRAERPDTESYITTEDGDGNRSSLRDETGFWAATGGQWRPCGVGVRGSATIRRWAVNPAVRLAGPDPERVRSDRAATATGRYWAGVVNKHIKLSPDGIQLQASAGSSLCAKAAEIATSSGAMSVEVSSV